MTKTIRLSGPMRHALAAAAGQRLMQTLDAIAHSPSGPPGVPPDLRQLVAQPFAVIKPRLSRDAHWALTRDPAADRDPVWNDICRRADGLHNELRSRHLPSTPDGRQERLVNLTFVTAAVMIPLLAQRGVYRRAVRLGEAARRLAMGDRHRLILGGGAEGADPRMRFLVLSPVFWSLAAFHPAAQSERSNDR